jgi:nucleotide-binding universal stress UspA family protein
LYETKRSFSKILAAVDGSEQSFKAAEYAIGIGKKYSAQLIALTVLVFYLYHSTYLWFERVGRGKERSPAVVR